MNNNFTPDQLIKLAVSDIVENINTGDSPQAATLKVAKELKLNHNYIKRASEAVNVALHHAYFKKHPDSKADDFETVDAQKVAEDIYGQKEKTAAEMNSELFSSFKSPVTVPKFARYLEDGPYKEAFELIQSSDTTSKNETSQSGLFKKSSDHILKLNKKAYEAEAEALNAEQEVNQSFCDILRKFAKDQAYRSGWDEFETGVFSKYGEACVPYLDLLYSTAKLNEERGKHDASVKLASLCSEVELYDKFVANVKTRTELIKAAEDASYNLKFEEDYLKEIFHKVGCELNRESLIEMDGSLLEKVEASMKEERTKIATADPEDPIMKKIADDSEAALNFIEENLKSAVDLLDMATGKAQGLFENEGKPSVSASSNNPANNRSRALLLQDLITTDPVINKFPTHKVVDAYQQMLRIAPELSSEKEITRAYLRQAGASQALSPFEAGELLKANTALFKQHQLQQGMNPAPDKAN